MELHFQQQQNAVTKGSKFKGRNRSSSNTNRFVSVRQRPSGRWVAEIKGTTQKIRMWLGTFKTAEEAAQAYDEAACLLRGSNTHTNFITHVPSNSPLASRIRNLLDRKMAVKQKHLPTCNTSAGANTSCCTLSNDMNVETQVPDDDYKSSISNFSEGFELVSSRSDPSWVK